MIPSGSGENIPKERRLPLGFGVTKDLARRPQSDKAPREVQEFPLEIDRLGRYPEANRVGEVFGTDQPPASEDRSALDLKLLDTLDSMFSDVIKQRRRLDPTDVSTLHRLRVAIKKYRYGVEALEPVLQGFDRRNLKKMHDLQDWLGNLHDLEVLSGSFRDFIGQRDRSHEQSRLVPVQRDILKRHNDALRQAMASVDRTLEFWKAWSGKGTARLRIPGVRRSRESA